MYTARQYIWVAKQKPDSPFLIEFSKIMSLGSKYMETPIRLSGAKILDELIDLLANNYLIPELMMNLYKIVWAWSKMRGHPLPTN